LTGADHGHPDAVEERVEVAPGAEIALCRREGAGEVVLLVHGISSNHHFWDVSPEHSLARRLHEAGLDVWNLDLRGHGQALRTSKGRRVRGRWNLDSLGTQDLPMALDLIRRRTGVSRVHVVAHSLGGVVLASMLAHRGAEGVASMVVVGSPLQFAAPDPLTRMAFGGSRWIPARFAPTRWPARLLARFPDTSRVGGLQDLLFSMPNTEPEARDLALRTVVSPISMGELRHLARSQHQGGRVTSWDGAVDYVAGLQAIDVPALVVTGRADRVAAPDRVKVWYDALRSEDKEFLVLSRAWGYRADYGHLDYAVGVHAAEELHRQIAAFVTERSVRGTGPAAAVGGPAFPE
jgi:pimeloyl-ACP methyl ester carboxylesterase